MPEYDTRNQLYALVGVVFVLLAVGVVIMTPPASGYEPSVYAAFPIYFPLLLVGAIFAGHLAIYRTARKNATDNRTWILGVVPVMLVNALILFMPYIRGYPVYGRADVLTHVGYAKNIAATGVITDNIYPNIHLLINAIAFATGLEPIDVINLVPIAFSFAYLGGTYFLVKTVFDNDSLVLFAVPLTTLLLFGSVHLAATPYGLSTILVPLVLYLLIKEQRTKSIPFRAALIVSLVGLVIYHPLTTLFFIFVLVIYFVARASRRFDSMYVGPTNVASITFVVFVTWYLNFAGIVLRFESVFNSLVGNTQSPSALDSYTSTVSRTSPELVDLLRIVAFRYGRPMILFTLAGLFVLAVVVLYLRDIWTPGLNIYTIVLIICFGGFGMGAFLFLVNDFPVGWGRPLMFAIISSIVLAGPAFYLFWMRSDGEVWLRRLDISYGVILLLLIVLTVYGVFPSPVESSMNPQVTEMELEGTEWTLDHRNSEYLTEEFGVSQHRFFDVESGTGPLPDGLRNEGTLPPPHFNYTVHRTLGQSYTDNRYLMISELGRITYVVRYPEYREFWSFTPEDFARVERDQTVTRVYDNGEFDLYLISGTRTDTVQNSSSVNSPLRPTVQASTGDSSPTE